MKYIIQYDKFYLELELEIFESDISYTSNTILNVLIKSDVFYANTTMDIDIKEFAKFAEDICELYKRLNGLAVVKESYGNQQFIEFSCDKMGHVILKGYVTYFTDNCCYKLNFENEIDQTCLKEFVESIREIYKRYTNN